MREYAAAIREREDESTEEDPFTEVPILEMGKDPETGELVEKYRRIIRVYTPESGQLGYLLATAASSFASEEEKVAGMLNFFVECLDPEDKAYIGSRLLDRRDDFGLTEINDIMEDLIEEWSGRPIKQPSDFQPSARSAGQKSRRTTRPAISST